MCEEWERNRRTVTKIIFSKPEFTEQEVSERYFSETRSFRVDHRSVRAYLKDLREHGALCYERGRYVVRSPKN